MKSDWSRVISSMIQSLPARGAWVEIAISAGGKTLLTSLPARGAWVEILEPS